MRSGAAHPRFLRQPRDLIFRLLKSLTAADFRVRGSRRLSRRYSDYRCGQIKRNVPLYRGWNHGSGDEGVFLDCPHKIIRTNDL